MKKQITEISMLTGDLYYDYVQPAAIAAGITEEVTAHHDTWGDYTTYHVDADAANEIVHCMYCACMNAHIALHQYGSEAEARQMLYQLEVSIKYHPETAEPLTALRNAIAAMLPQEAPQEAPAAEAEQQPTETENAPQAATQAAELDTLKALRDDITTDPNPDTIRAAQDAINRHFVEIDPEDIDTPRKIRAALTDIINTIYWDIAEDITPAQQADDITAAIIDSMTAPAPAQTITATIIGPDGTPYRAQYTADMLDSLRTESRVLDIQDDTTGELVYIRP